MGFEMSDDYVDVAARIREFREKYPDGSLQPVRPEEPFTFVEWADRDGQVVRYIVYAAAAFRTPYDERPGIGVAQELIPGRTPYTRNSELQNAETSAWGRAIVAALAADTNKGVASTEEVRNRRADQQQEQEERQSRAQTDAQALATQASMATTAQEVRNLYRAASAQRLSEVPVQTEAQPEALALGAYLAQRGRVLTQQERDVQEQVQQEAQQGAEGSG